MTLPLRVRRHLYRHEVRAWGGARKVRMWERFVWRRRPRDRWRALARHELDRAVRF